MRLFSVSWRVMFDWNRCLREALVDLGAQEELKAGARVRWKLEQLFGDEFRSWAAEQQPRKFLDLVAEAADTEPRLILQRFVGQDFLVGFADAREPTFQRATRGTEAAPPLRSDVFQAFTVAATSPYYYIPGDDVFTCTDVPPEGAIAIPKVDQASLVEQRRAFADGIENATLKDELLKALADDKPLAAFQARTTALGLQREWRAFKLRSIAKTIREWAQTHDVATAETWITSPNQSRTSPQAFLSQVAHYMTDTEIRALSIPLRAIERMYSARR